MLELAAARAADSAAFVSLRPSASWFIGVECSSSAEGKGVFVTTIDHQVHMHACALENMHACCMCMCMICITFTFTHFTFRRKTMGMQMHMNMTDIGGTTPLGMRRGSCSSFGL